MVTYGHTGRLGNVLFAAATAYAYSLEHGLGFHPLSETHNKEWFPVYLGHLKNPGYNPRLPKIQVHEKRHCFDKLPYEDSWRNNNIVLNGYFQSEKYFWEYRNEILKAFRFNWIPIKGVVSIHIRRGDYLKYPLKHPTVTIEYITKAIKVYTEQGYTHFQVYGDDYQWNKSNVNEDAFPGCRFDYIRGNSEITDLELMSSCEHHIISNSSFSWWAAWLNQNPNKFVVCPHEDNHFGPDNKQHDVSDFYPIEWHRIKYTPIYEL